MQSIIGGFVRMTPVCQLGKGIVCSKGIAATELTFIRINGNRNLVIVRIGAIQHFQIDKTLLFISGLGPIVFKDFG